MPDIFAETARDWRAAEERLRHLMHHGAPHPAVTQPQPAIPHNETQEEPPMSLIATLEADAKALAAKFEQVDHDAVNLLDRVQANPATAEGLAILGQLTHVPPESLANAIGMLKLALQALGGDQAAFTPPQVPAGPQVGGQA